MSAPRETKSEHTLASFDVHTLTLYKVKIDVPEKEIFKKVISQDVVYLNEELDHPFSKLPDTFNE